MKSGKTLVELAQELERQNAAKKDYLVDTRDMEMVMRTNQADENQCDDVYLNVHSGGLPLFGINEIAHQQIATNLGIPTRYYDKMRGSHPELLVENVNTWLGEDQKTRMIRTLDGTARAYLSDRYRRIDNHQIAQAVLPLISGLPDARVESCEITERRLYLKVVNPRLEAEIVPGDAVQSGLIISNSEVGLGSVQVQPLIFRLVCTNGMVVNDAGTKKKHVGRASEAGEDYSIFTNETLLADDRAFMLKVRDTVRSIAEQVHFDRVVAMMREAKGAKITTPDIPKLVELAAKEYTITQDEGAGVLDYLIRGGDLSLYGLANAVTRKAQEADSYDRATELEGIGYNVLSMPARLWRQMNSAGAMAA